jgi:hypothetical protein
MTPQYQRKLSKSLLLELARLKMGSVSEKQRYQNALSAMNKVMSDPLSHDFKKNLPDSYKAVDVLQQYRLFFKIYSSNILTNTVYFVWINSEESIHRTGKSNDCYTVFEGMIGRGEVEAYLPDPEVAGERFKRFEDWELAYIYVSFWRRLNSVDQRADSHLILSQIREKNFLLQNITVSETNSGLAQSLMRHLCDDLDRHQIVLTYELYRGEEHESITRHLLEKFNFHLEEEVEEAEVWTRQAKSK